MIWFWGWATRKDNTTKYILAIVNWLAKRIERVADKIDRLHDSLGSLATKKDIAQVLREVKSLRDYLSQPTIEMTAGKPQDKEL